MRGGTSAWRLLTQPLLERLRENLGKFFGGNGGVRQEILSWLIGIVG